MGRRTRARSRSAIIPFPLVVGEEPPPVGGEFGPSPSVQAIRDAAGPITVSDPGGGVTFTSRADLQNKINANPANTIFVAQPGLYDWDQVISTSTKHPRIYFLGAPGQAIIDGGGREIYGINGSNSGGEIHGGTWRNFGTNQDSPATIGFVIRTGWLAEDFICEYNHRAGFIAASNSGAMTARRFSTRHNGNFGITGGQDTLSTWGPDGGLFEQGEIWDNNTRHLPIGGDAGGTKFYAGWRNSTWRQMWVHDNWGSGLWWDGQHSQMLAEDIVSENNRNWGGFVELGYGSSIFRRWYLKDNCWDPSYAIGSESNWYNNTQFLISCVDGTRLPELSGPYPSTQEGGVANLFADSIIDGNNNRAMGIITHDAHPIPSKAAHFYHNQVWLRNSAGINGQVGGLDSDSVQDMWSEPDILFDYNEYHVANLATAYWRWGGTTGTARDWTAWRNLGKDPNGSRQLI